jgi:hypothetical protein
MSDRPAPGRHRVTDRPTDPRDLTTHSRSDSRGPNRRQVLTLGSIAVAAVATKTTLGSSPAAAATPTPQWPGHKPGKIYLGTSGPNLAASLAQTGPTGLRRTYYTWSGGAAETRNINQDHAAHRLPWISFDPVSTAAGGWAAVASGKYDADIRARARRYATYAKPVIVTFNHEPHVDNTGTPAEFAKAWTHIHDVMKSETSLKNIISVPIIGDWCYNPINKNGHPEAYITEAVLSRCHFLGVDLYQNSAGDGYAVRLGRILAWLDARGHSTKMVGLGETGCTNGFGSPTAVQWWTAGWTWAAGHTSRVCAISYFNSVRNNNLKQNWLLSESAAKLAAFKASLTSTTACKL